MFGIGCPPYVYNQWEVYFADRNSRELPKRFAKMVKYYEDQLEFRPAIFVYQMPIHMWREGITFSESCSSQGIIPILQLSVPNDNPDFQFQAWIKESNIVNQFAQAVRRYGEEHGGLFITPMWEMNIHAPHCPWQWCYNPERFKTIWKDLWERLEAEGANRFATWTISFYEYGSKSPWWPGDQYVDWFALSGYNRNIASHQGPRSLGRIVDPWLNEYPNKPFMMQEFGTTKDNSQPYWIRDALTYIKKSNVKAALYWDNTNYELRDDHELSAESMAQLRTQLKDPHFVPGRTATFRS
jgi:hypothetical protein